MKSKKKIKKSKIKKDRPFEVQSQSMETTTKQPKKCRSDDMLLFEDLVLEILSRLPVQSLLRFMCVCKQWKTLISSHPFRKLHREKHTSSPPLLVTSYNSHHLEVEPYDPKLYIYTYLITSDLEGKLVKEITLPFPSSNFTFCKPAYQSKLLCFFNKFCGHPLKFYLYNPSTRQSFLMSDPSSFSSQKLRHYCVEFGYIPSKDEYIMVHLVNSNGKFYCEVLNNISISNDNFKLHYINQWRSSTEVPIMMHFGTSGVFVGGAFYWIMLSVKNSDDEIILSFDAETECFSTIACPENRLSSGSLYELKDELYLVDNPENDPPILTMWKLSSDKKLWTRYWEFDFERLFGFTSVESWFGYFSCLLFIYNLKYLKGYEDQPRDDQVSVEMGMVRLIDGFDGMPAWSLVAVHTNLFTL